MSLWGSIRGDRRKLAALIGAPLLVGAGVGAALLTPPPEPAPTPTPVPTASPSPTPSPTSRPTPSPSPTPSPTPDLLGLEDGRITVLVLGSDSDAARRARGKAGLTDAITVISVAEDGSDIAIISLPRDTTDLPMPDGSTWTTKVNAITALRGPAVMRDAMAGLLALQIDRYLLLDMDDFRRLVDAVGGVTVSVPYTLGDRRCTIAAGTRHLDGSLALCFARNRASDSDYARAGRHQQLLLALRDRLLAGSVDLGALAASLGSLQTDIRADELPAYAGLLARSSSAVVTRLVLSPPSYTTFAGEAGTRGWISVPNVPAIQQAVADLVGR